MSVRTHPGGAVLLVLLAGCASYGPGRIGPGQTEQQVIAAMGTPTDRVALAGGGTRLEYARGPMGHHTYRVELDGAGRVGAVSQVLTEENFAQVRPGDSKAALRERLGRPSEVGGAFGQRELWSYRYENPLCLWYVVTLSRDERVEGAAYLKDPQCSERGEPPVLP